METAIRNPEATPRGGGWTAVAQRHSRWISWVSIGVIVVGLLLMMKQLPLDDLLSQLKAWIAGLGIWGPVVYALIYVVATVFLVPASPITIAGGAAFGLVTGLVASSIASTVGAALAFLVGRYLARDKVARVARKYPRFGAVDRAISEGGWKIVALLRLSPAIPFNLQNYLYGLTAIRFWPYVLTSWLAMLPGAFMYVYIGYLGRASLEAAAEEGSTSVGKWVLWTVGLLATIAVTVYITRLARRMIKEQTDIEQAAPEGDQPAETDQTPHASERRWPWGATAAAVLAVLVLTTTVLSYTKAGVLKGLVGPPPVVPKEAYEVRPDGPSFDHTAFDRLLEKHVRSGGWVDYKGIREDEAKLDEYIAAVADAPFERMGRNEKLALLINAYNAFTIRLILDHWPVDSIKDIPSDKRWEDSRWEIGAHTWSLNEIEHEQIRPKFKDARIHFALVCAAVGCPPLREEAYQADRIDAQLQDQAEYVHSHGRWFRFDPGSGVVKLTKVYSWYRGDFEHLGGSVLDYAAQYAPELRRTLEEGRRPTIEWLPYDWSLNSVGNRPSS